MSYYASYEGEIKFKEGILEEQIIQTLRSFYKNSTINRLSYADDPVEINSDETGTLCGNFIGYAKYRDDEIVEWMYALKPICDRISIEYSGEDGSLWRLLFDSNKGNKIFEQNGRVVYDEPGEEVYYEL